MVNNVGTASIEEPSQGSNLPASGAEWVELLVGEVLSASNVEDAKARLSLGLEALEKSIRDRAAAEAANSFQKVSVVLFYVKRKIFSICAHNDVHSCNGHNDVYIFSLNFLNKILYVSFFAGEHNAEAATGSCPSGKCYFEAGSVYSTRAPKGI